MIKANMCALYNAIVEVAKAYADQAAAAEDYTLRDYAVTEVTKAEQKLENALNEMESRFHD